MPTTGEILAEIERRRKDRLPLTLDFGKLTPEHDAGAIRDAISREIPKQFQDEVRRRWQYDKPLTLDYSKVTFEPAKPPEPEVPAVPPPEMEFRPRPVVTREVPGAMPPPVPAPVLPLEEARKAGVAEKPPIEYLPEEIAAATAYEAAGLIKGLTLGYASPEKYLETTWMGKQKIHKPTALISGQIAGAVAPIGLIAKGVGTLLRTAGVLKGVAPLLQRGVQAGVMGSIYGVARKPEEEGLQNRLQNALEDTAYFITFTGAGALFDKAYRTFTMGKIEAYNSLKADIVKKFRVAGVSPEKAEQMAEFGLDQAIKKGGGWGPLTTKDLKGARKAIKKGYKIVIGDEKPPTPEPSHTERVSRPLRITGEEVKRAEGVAPAEGVVPPPAKELPLVAGKMGFPPPVQKVPPTKGLVTPAEKVLFRKVVPYTESVQGKPYIVKGEIEEFRVYEAKLFNKDPEDLVFIEERRKFYHDRGRALFFDSLRKAKAAGLNFLDKNVMPKETQDVKSDLYKMQMMMKEFADPANPPSNLPDWAIEAKAKRPIAEVPAPEPDSPLETALKPFLPDRIPERDRKSIMGMAELGVEGAIKHLVPPQNMADVDSLIAEEAGRLADSGLSEEEVINELNAQLNAVLGKRVTPEPSVKPAERPPGAIEPAPPTEIAPEPRIEPPAPPEKQPWEMTREEYLEYYATPDIVEGKAVLRTPPEEGHFGVVKQALAEGRSVPAEVLADYPELAKAPPVEEPIEKKGAWGARPLTEAEEPFPEEVVPAMPEPTEAEITEAFPEPIEPEAPAEEVSRVLHQLSSEEFKRRFPNAPEGAHKAIIKAALYAGQKVDPEVTAKYPDIVSEVEAEARIKVERREKLEAPSAPEFLAWLAKRKINRPSFEENWKGELPDLPAKYFSKTGGADISTLAEEAVDMTDKDGIKFIAEYDENLLLDTIRRAVAEKEFGRPEIRERGPEYLQYEKGRPVPMMRPLPEKGMYPALRLDTGDVFYVEATELHTDIIKKFKLPPELIESGGYVNRGFYEPSVYSTIAQLGERARAQAILERKGELRERPSEYAAKPQTPAAKAYIKEHPDMVGYLDEELFFMFTQDPAHVLPWNEKAQELAIVLKGEEQGFRDMFTQQTGVVIPEGTTEEKIAKLVDDWGKEIRTTDEKRLEMARRLTPEVVITPVTGTLDKVQRDIFGRELKLKKGEWTLVEEELARPLTKAEEKVIKEARVAIGKRRKGLLVVEKAEAILPGFAEMELPSMPRRVMPPTPLQPTAVQIEHEKLLRGFEPAPEEPQLPGFEVQEAPVRYTAGEFAKLVDQKGIKIGSEVTVKTAIINPDVPGGRIPSGRKVTIVDINYERGMFLIEHEGAYSGAVPQDIEETYRKPVKPPPPPKPPAVKEVPLAPEPGEPEIIASTSKAFNEHMDYFRNRQLPESSEIRNLQKEIQKVNGRRLAGTITPAEANKLIANLRRDLFTVAQKEGISVRMSGTGKLFLSVRQSGVYVPVEFSQYPKFQDVEEHFGGTTDITRLIQQIDGSLSKREKLKLPGQAGQAEQQLLWPARDISIQKIGYIKEKQLKAADIMKGIKPKSEKDIAVNEVLRILSTEQAETRTMAQTMARPTIKRITTDTNVIMRARALRDFYNELMDEQNSARRIRGQAPIPFRKNYSPEILRDVTIWERMLGKDQKDIVTKAELPDYIRPNKPFNPRELARDAGIEYEERVLSAIELLQQYIPTAAKDIFNTSIIQNNKAFIQQFETLGLKKSAGTIAQWTNEAYAGVKPALTRAIKLTPGISRAMVKFNRIRNIAVFPLNFSWSFLTQTSSYALTVGKYGARDSFLGLVDWLNPKTRAETSEKYYSYIVKAEKQGRITRQDAQNLIGREVEIYRTTGELLRDASTLVLEQLEKLLTGMSIQAARRSGIRAGLTGKALDEFASDGGSKTQSMYNDEDRPGLLRALIVKTVAPFQTFNYEVMNTIREWAGTTGTPPDDAKERIWQLIRFIATATVFASIAKTLANKEIWSWKRPPIPFAEYWLSPVIKAFTGAYLGGTYLPSPVQMAANIGKGLHDVLETGDWRKLRTELIKYGPGFFGFPGGVQSARMVDAIIAYSKGGVYDKRGKLMFPMKDPQDLIQGMFSGVWTTKAGREYLERREGKKKEPVKWVIPE